MVTARLTTPRLNETQIAENKIKDTFGSTNMVALVVPSGDYDKEREVLNELSNYPQIDYTMGIVNIEAMDGYMLGDALTPRQFSELADLDYEVAQLLYTAYAVDQEDYGKLAGNIASYQVPLMDMLLYACDQVDAGIVTSGCGSGGNAEGRTDTSRGGEGTVVRYGLQPYAYLSDTSGQRRRDVCVHGYNP